MAGDVVVEPALTGKGDVADGTDACSTKEADLERIYARTSRHIIPLFVCVAIVNHIDRTNVAFASLTMNADLGFNAAVYGLGSSLFFVGFFLCQVPSNLIVMRVGARIWLSLLLIGWGAVATCSAFITTQGGFYAVRILLGAFEAGAFPGMWYYLSLFYAADRITKPYAWLGIGILLANVLGAPLAAGFLAMDGLAGLHGWQWLFLLEGFPSVILGLLVPLLLPRSPKTAKWLTEGDRELLLEDIAAKEVDGMVPGLAGDTPGAITTTSSSSSKALHKQPLKLIALALRNPLLYYITVCGLLFATAAYTVIFWLPIVVNGLLHNDALSSLKVSSAGHSRLQGVIPVLLAAIPYTCGAVLTWILAHSAQKRKELYFHVSIPFIISGIAFILFTPLTQAHYIAGFVSLVVTVAFAGAGNGVIAALVAEVTAGPAQGVSMPLFNSFSSLGGFLGPFITGALVQKFGGFKWPSIIMGTFILAVGIGLLALRWIAAAWKDHMLRTRGNLGSLPSGFSSQPSHEDFVERGGHPSQVGMLDADRNGVTSRAAGRAGRGHSKE